MGITKGTKFTDNPKNKTFKIRLDEKTSEKLDILSRETKWSKAEVIRNGIELQYENLNQK